MLSRMIAPAWVPAGPALLLWEPETGIAVVICAIVGVLLWRIREHRLEEHRAGVRALYALTEDLLGARSAADLASRLQVRLSHQPAVAAFQLYLYDRETGRLASADHGGEAVPVTPESDHPLTQCYRTGRPVAVADVRTVGERLPGRSALLVPVDAQDRAAGVLAIFYTEGRGKFSEDQQAAARHVARHIGFVLDRLEQQAVREQLSRGERMAAAGRLLASAFEQIEEPLRRLVDRAERAASPGGPAASVEMENLAADARRCLELAERLGTGGATDAGSGRTVDLQELVSRLVEARRTVWEDAGFAVGADLTPGEAAVSGSELQLREALDTLMPRVAPAGGPGVEGRLTVTLGRVGTRVTLRIGHPTPAETEDYPADPKSLAFARSIIEAHGGRLRRFTSGGREALTEIELPAAGEPPEGEPDENAMAASPMTALVVEPDAQDRRWLTEALARRGHRVVPVASSEEGADLAERFVFDALFCSAMSDAPGARDWIERMTRRVRTIVVLADNAAAEPPAAVGAVRIRVLPKPLGAGHLDRLLGSLPVE